MGNFRRTTIIHMNVENNEYETEPKNGRGGAEEDHHSQSPFVNENGVQGNQSSSNN